MDEMRYAKLTEVHGRWLADILESYLRAEEIDVVLVQDAVSHITHVTTFAPVMIYVPKVSIKRARDLLKTFNNAQDGAKEKIGMANKKKIEERLEAERRARQARFIQIGGVGIILVVIVAAFWAFDRKGQSSVGVGDQSACSIFESIPVSAQYSAPPMGIDQSKQYYATVKMAKGGEFVIQLFPDKAPITVNSFVFLACKGYFDGVTFHRVIEGFMAQGGDPTGTGTGGPGYEFVNEDSDLIFDKAGVVAMGNRGRDTNGSQFFITFAPYLGGNGDYTIFGQVVQGMDVVNGITRREPTQADFPGDAMESVTITEQ